MEELDASSTSNSPVNDSGENGLKLGLALSGGGFRATLFHLGVIRSLRDNGYLNKVHHICSVSGGSILAAHLLLNWEAYNSQDDDEFDKVAQQIIDFTKHDVRGRVLRRGLTFIPFLAIFRKICFNKIPKVTFSTLLQHYYEKLLFKKEIVEHLPEHPKINILTTNLTEGGVCSVTNKGFSIDENPTKNLKEAEFFISGNITLSLAVTCSSAFPGMFPPLKLNKENIYIQNFLPENQYFTDGGVFDNLGIRKFRKCLNDKSNQLTKVLVSNAGSTFKRETDLGLSDLIIPTALRSSDILFDRLNQTEYEISKEDDRFIFININEIIPTSKNRGNQSKKYFDNTAINENFQKWLKHIRTDLDAFPNEAICSLISHGQSVTRKVLKEDLKLPIQNSELWFPLKSEDSCFQKKNFQKTHKILQKSASRSIRLFSGRDWITYLHILIVIILSPFVFIYIPSEIDDAMDYWKYYFTSEYPAEFKTWDEEKAKTTEVDSLEDPIHLNHGFTVLKDEKRWDLRQIKDVPESEIKTVPRSAAKLVRYFKIRKDAPKEDELKSNDKFTINFKTEGAAIYPRVKDLKFHYSIQKSRKNDTVHGIKVKRYALVVSVPEEKVKAGEEFELFVEVIYWNGFQKNEQWLGFQADEKIDEISMGAISRKEKKFKNLVYTYGPRHSETSFTGDLKIIEKDGYAEFYWRIEDPQENWYYRLDWAW